MYRLAVINFICKHNKYSKLKQKIPNLRLNASLGFVVLRPK